MIPGASSLTIDQFNGAFIPSASYMDSTKVPLSNGIAARNTQYFGNGVATRAGFTALFTPGDAITAIINWLFLNGATPANYAAWYAPGKGVRTANLASPSASTVITETIGVTASIQPSGARLYCGFMDANGIGVAPGQVYGFGVGADPLFAPPITTAPTFSEIGTPGTTTTGPHNFGYVIQTRNGFITRPSPAPGSNFTPASYTSLGAEIFMSVDPPSHAWPAYAQNVAAIMATNANPNAYFIVPSPYPGVTPWFSVNRTGATSIAIGVTDDYLAAAGQDATPYLNQISQTVTGTAPFDPAVIYAYGQRIAYVTRDSAGVPVTYFSDSSSPQSVNAATSGVYLPGNLPQTTGFALGGNAYLFGPHWTFSTADNNGVPATWAQPQQVDGSKGAAGPFCVALSPKQQFGWVANQGGLYIFTGSYPDRPVSYWQTQDWNRINFGAPTKIQVTDNDTAKTVCVLAPLDGATDPTHILTWDYSLGITPEQVQYSLWDINDYQAGAMAVLQNATSRRLELCLAPSDAAKPIGRQMNVSDTAPFLDFGQNIADLYETSPLPRGMSGRVIMHHGATMRIRGQGTVQLTVWALDHGNSVGPFTIGLSIGAASEFLQRFFLSNEYVTLQIQSGAESWFQLSRIDHYYTPGLPHR